MPPAPNIPIVDYPQQVVVLDTIIVERTSNQLGNYKVTEPGAAYPKGTHSSAQVALFDGNEFLGQKATSDQEWMQRFFGRQPSTQDVQNWEESYDESATSFPAFQRRYLEKRDGYTARATGTALPGIYRIPVTNGGAGYKVPPIVSFIGGTGSGAAAIAILNNNGAVTKITVKSEGNYTVAPAVVLTAASGDPGAGAAATAVIQPAGCVLTKETATDNAPEPYRSLYLLVSRLYETMPGPILVSHEQSSEVRGEVVDTYSQRGLTGTLPTEDGALIISSKVSPLSAVVDQRVSTKVDSLPPTEITYDYTYVDIPRRIFALPIEVVCNLTDQYTVLVRPVSLPAGSFIRKHRTTVEYSATPTGDTALNIITRADIDYEGKAINHHYHGVLNNTITFTGDATVGGCTWTESYTFPASSPSASSFSGQWWLISRQTVKWGTSGWMTKTIEFFEP